MKALLIEHVLKGSYKPPFQKDLKELTLQLNKISIEAKRGGELFRSYSDSSQELALKLIEVKRLLPTFIEARKRMALFGQSNPSDIWIVEEVRGHCALAITPFIDRSIQSASMLDAAIDQFTTKDNPAFVLDMGADLHWKMPAFAIASCFVRAMIPSNPDKIFGASNGGPVARFVSAVLPLTTGDSVAPETVSAHLKKCRAQEGKSGS